MDLAEYTAAYDSVTAAQEAYDTNPDRDTAAALAAASDRLRAAEAPVADVIDAVWQAHVDGIAAAKAELDTARRALTEIEIDVGNTARARNPVRPVLSDDEIARVETAAAAVVEAHRRLVAAEAVFKAGVTPDDVAAAKEPA